MERDLEALAGQEAAFREMAFGRFLLAVPGRAGHFLNLPVSSVRMADMALAWLLAEARGEWWLEGEVAEIVHTHLGFGDPGAADYGDFLDDVIAALAGTVGLDADGRAAWEAAAVRLKARVAAMRAAWRGARA
jgi:hypothetical protein